MQKYFLFSFLLIGLLIAAPTGTLYAQQSKNPSTDSYTAQLQNQLQHAKHDTTKLRILKELIEANINTQPHLAEKWIKEAISTAQKNKDVIRQIDFQLLDLRLLNQQGQFKLTVEKSAQIKQLLLQHGSPKQQTALLMSVGNAGQRLGMYDSAASVYNQVIRISHDNKLREIEVTASMNLAILFQYQNRTEEMKEHLLQTLAMVKLYGLSDNVPMIQLNLSNAEARLNNFGKAIEYLNEVIPFYIKKNNQYILGLAYANLSWCYFKSEKLNMALEYARNSYQIRTALKDAAGIEHLDLNLSKIFLGLGKYDSAGIYAQSALKKSHELHLVNDIRDNYETLAHLNERQGNYQSAMEYYRLFADWKDSVNHYEKTKMVQQELQKIKSDSLQFLKQLIANTEKQKNRFQNWVWLLAAGILLLAFMLIFQKSIKQFIIGKNKLQAEENNEAVIALWQQKLADHIEKSRNEQADLKKQYDEVLIVKNSLQAKLEQLESADIKELRELIESDKLHSDGYWNEFLVIFSRVYPDFFKRLKSAHPDLTQHELKICAMIKLNHSVADTAKVLNITVESVRKARYRLYKKMTLNNDQELVDTIIQS